MLKLCRLKNIGLAYNAPFILESQIYSDLSNDGLASLKAGYLYGDMVLANYLFRYITIIPPNK